MKRDEKTQRKAAMAERRDHWVQISVRAFQGLDDNH